jgi:hypothetical protein
MVVHLPTEEWTIHLICGWYDVFQAPSGAIPLQSRKWLSAPQPKRGTVTRASENMEHPPDLQMD